ncbi:MAG: tyrosine-type recombinase/integrase [Chlamydiota bacterium]
MDPLQTFRVFLEAEKGLSEKTVTAYLGDLEDLARFLGKPWSSILEADLLGYFSSLEGRYRLSSILRKMSAIRSFFRFLYAEHLIQAPLSEAFSGQKMRRILPEIFSVEEVEMLVHAPDPTTKIGARDRAIFSLLYATGIRVSECAHLKIADVQEESLRVRGKGSKERVVPVHGAALSLLDCYLSFRHDEVPWLFLTEREKRIDRITIYRRIRYYAQKLHFGSFSPHTFRHCFASHLLEKGASLRVIQELLGHEDIETVKWYLHLSSDQVKRAFFTFHPRP